MIRRFHRWLTRRYYDEDWSQDPPQMLVTVRLFDPLFWLWLWWKPRN